MNVLGRIFLNSLKDGKTERRKDRVFLWDVEELTHLKIRGGIPTFLTGMAFPHT